MQSALAVAATLISLAFAMSTFERLLRDARRHELAWSVALALFCIASGCLAAGSGLGWNPTLFRLFYFFGAIANVPVLALGTIYLMGGERVGNRAAVSVTVVCAFAAGVVAVAPLGPISSGELAQGGDVFGPLPRVLAAMCSAGGTLVIMAGAVMSAVRRRNRRAVVANILIVAGVGISGASGLLNGLVGNMEAFSLTLVLGISVLFVGFLTATSAIRPSHSSSTQHELSR